MDTQKQIIEVVLITTEAERQANARSQNEQRRTKADADAAKKAAKEVSDAQIKAAKEAAAAAKAAAKEVLAAEKSTAAERKSAEEALQKWSVREYKDRVRQQVQEAKRLAAEEAKAVVEAQKAKAAAAQEATKKWDEQKASIMGSVKSVGLFTAGMVGLNSVSTVLHMIAEQFNAIRVAGMKASADIMDEALDLRQLGALQGEMGQPSQQLLQQLAMRTKTLQTGAEAREMTTEAMASGFGAINAGLVSAPEFQKHLETAGQLQKMTGAAAGAVGKMSGILPMVTGKGTNTAEDLNVLMERLYKEQQLGGFKDYGQAATQFAGSAEYVMKGVYKATTAQALLSAFAMAGQGDTASERLSQVTTAVSAGVLRNKGMKVNPDYENLVEKSGEYFKGLGVTTNTKTEDRIMAVVTDLMKKEDESKAAGLNWNPMDYLLEKGFINVQSRESLAKLAGVERTGGQLSSILKLGDSPLPAQSGVGSAFTKSIASDPTMAREEARAQNRLGQFKAGMGGKGEGLFRDAMYEKAFASLGGEAAFGGANLDAIKDRMDIDPRELLFRYRHNLEFEAQRQVMADAKKMGIQTPEGGSTAAGGVGVFLGWEKLFEIGQKTREAGGALTPGADPDKTNDLLTEIRDLMKKTVPEPIVGKPVAGQPAAAPVGPPLPIPNKVLPGRAP